MPKMTLTQFMDLLAAEGVVGEEYESRIAEFMARRDAGGGSAIERRGSGGRAMQTAHPSGIPFPVSAQDRRIRGTRANIPVDETPAQAEERWTREEMEDPNGIYSMGGSTAGGIFGSGPIATDGYDPGARHRAAPVAAAQAQVKTLEVLGELTAELRESREENKRLREQREREQLEAPRESRRRLGSKKR